MSNKTIFFIAGMSATKAEAAAIEKTGASCIRNASLVKPTDAIEKCGAVAGAVPAKYKALKGVKVIGAKGGKAASKPDKEDSLS